MPRWLDNRANRLWIGALVIAPLSALLGFYALNAALWGSLLTYMLATSSTAFDVSTRSIAWITAISGVFGLLGLVGAWVRIFHTNASLAKHPQLSAAVAVLLYLGMSGAIGVAFVLGGVAPFFVCVLPCTLAVFLLPRTHVS